jgi:hypothetical protein
MGVAWGMTIRRILQVSVPVVAAVSLLGACAADTTKVATKAPATIRVGARGAAGGGEKVAAATAGVADASMRIRPTNYVLAKGLVAPTGAKSAWFFPSSSAAATDSQKATLAKAFGLSGAWKTLPKDQGGYNYLGDASKGEASLTITNDALKTWWYSPSWSNASATVSCAEAGVAVGEPAPADVTVTAGNTATADPSSPTTLVDPELKPCEAPKPPANVPNKVEAEAKAKALLQEIGLDPNAYVLDTYADEWGAYVTGWLLVDGQRTQMAIGFGFGAEGALTSASGFLATPQRGDQYDLVTLDTAVKRLNDTNGYWTGYYGGGPVGIAARGVATDAVATVAGAVGSAASGEGSVAVPSTDPGLAPEPVPTEVGTVDTTPAVTETVPAITEPALDVMTVTLTGVTVGLSQLWDADGNVWLIPSYVFTSADGGQFSVYAIADEFLDFAAVANPAPVDSVAVEPAVTPTVDTVVVVGTGPVDTVATKGN